MQNLPEFLWHRAREATSSKEPRSLPHCVHHDKRLVIGNKHPELESGRVHPFLMLVPRKRESYQTLERLIIDLPPERHPDSTNPGVSSQQLHKKLIYKGYGRTLLSKFSIPKNGNFPL